MKAQIIALILSALALLGTAMMEYTHTDKENAVRISKLEAHDEDRSQRLDRIESKLDKLVDWALGKH